MHCDGVRVKVSKDVKVGMEFTVRQGFEEKTVVVKALMSAVSMAAIWAPTHGQHS